MPIREVLEVLHQQGSTTTAIGKPVLTLHEVLRDALLDRNVRVFLVDPRTNVPARVFTAGDALHALLYGDDP